MLPAPKMRLLQIPGAGIDQINFHEVPRRATVCNAYGQDMTNRKRLAEPSGRSRGTSGFAWSETKRKTRPDQQDPRAGDAEHFITNSNRLVRIGRI